MKRLSPFFFLILAFPLMAAGAGDDPAARTPARIRGRQMAPEFADIETWINSKPLTMAQLRGKVVVVHFMAFG